MSTRKGVLPLLSVALAMCAAHAQENSPQRVRAFAALPNWAGYWETEIAAAPFPPPQAGSDPNEEFLKRVTKMSKLQGKPPYNAEWERKSRSVLKRTGPAATPEPFEICGEGFPAIMEDPTPDGMFQILVTPEETLIVFQQNRELRHIFTDGRPHPMKQDLWPTALGDSIGHWEGPTLVIDTLARKAGPISPPPAFGVADLSDRVRFTERLTRLDADTLQDDMTIDDPQRFVHPWQLSIRYKRVTGIDRIMPTGCENDRNPIVNGKQSITPP
jgi:hypothetical protein